MVLRPTNLELQPSRGLPTQCWRDAVVCALTQRRSSPSPKRRRIAIVERSTGLLHLSESECSLAVENTARDDSLSCGPSSKQVSPRQWQPPRRAVRSRCAQGGEKTGPSRFSAPFWRRKCRTMGIGLRSGSTRSTAISPGPPFVESADPKALPGVVWNSILDRDQARGVGRTCELVLIRARGDLGLTSE